ncbi:AMIN domain-containing protein [Leptolyngbya sp. FACHB-261]|uniref:AMIN domain-containing protein n=1 Tax=Leptolyngbya sp. FACHB-261 TaxID=2692806 RepID=UPI00168242DF|nr:AMIN domain-containing protein [Leptolyngbya sp. FACHB-261]MBD2100488.1 AMIN domain-containing protein [Leptolyngbya sp. FACHB-261]
MKLSGPLVWLLVGMGSGLAGLPAWAADSQVTGIRLSNSGNRLELSLDLKGQERPQISTSRQGNTWVADLTGSSLKLASGGGQYRQSDPAPGITSVYAIPMGEDRVRIMVTGSEQPPSGTVTQRPNGEVVFSLASAAPANRLLSSNAALPVPPRPNPATANVGTAANTVAQAPARPSAPSVAAPAAPTSAPAANQPNQPAARPAEVAPSPEIAAQARRIIAQAERPNQPNAPLPNNTPQPAPPFQPGAVPPPVGDIAIGNINLVADTLDLGGPGQARVRRLVLREAPVRDVLQILSDTSGLSFVFREPEDVPGTPVQTVVTQTGASQVTTTTAAAEGRPASQAVITASIQNETVQDVFNYVLRVTGLQANRIGNTIFVGSSLPTAVQNLVMRTYRLNQIPATLESGTLQRDEGGTLSISGGDDIVRDAYETNRTATLRGAREQLLALAGGGQPLQGLQVIADARLNTVTLIGTPNIVNVASSYLAQLDARRRQVAVSVRIVDVAVNNTSDLGTSFQFRVGNYVGNINQNIGSPTTGNNVNFNFSPIPAFNATINASISNGTAKILTDPTLVIQEGSEGRVNVTQDVIGNIIRTVTAGSTTSLNTETVTAQIVQVGIILAIAVPQIDDNGFVTMYVDPVVSAPSVPVTLNTGGSSNASNVIQLIQRRQLSTGAVRVRDGQSLILAGLIDDSDQNTVSKVPILGDIPLLGALFRRTTTNRTRREVVVIITPHIVEDSDIVTAGYQYQPNDPDVRRLIEEGQRREPSVRPAGNTQTIPAQNRESQAPAQPSTPQS